MTFNNKQKNLLIFCNELDYCGNETTKKELGKKMLALKAKLIINLSFNVYEDMTKDENIGNHGYIGTSILQIYRKYRRNINGYFFTNIDKVKII